jgi:hypothetical protein
LIEPNVFFFEPDLYNMPDLVVLQCKANFLLRNEAQKKHLSFVPNSMVKVLGAASRVQMNAPGALDPAPNTRDIFALFANFPLDCTDAVIHSATTLCHPSYFWIVVRA